jgi:hypothetical protein
MMENSGSLSLKNRKRRPVVKNDKRCQKRQEAGGSQVTAGGEDWRMLTWAWNWKMNDPLLLLFFLFLFFFLFLERGQQRAKNLKGTQLGHEQTPKKKNDEPTWAVIGRRCGLRTD